MPIDHLVVLVLENRSFDHMLGFLDHPDPAFAGLATGRHDNPGYLGGAPVAATPTAKRVLPVGPNHTHDAVMEQLAVVGSGAGRRPTNQGFVTSYERTARGLARPRYGGLLGPLLNLVIGNRRSGGGTAGLGRLVMACQPPEHVPVLSRLAREFAVCDHWFCSVPGETWPNRNFFHAATSDGETDLDLRPYDNPTIFELLEKQGRTWRVYHDDTPQVWAFPRLWDTPQRHGNWFPTAKFAVHAAAGGLATYSFIEPNHRPPVHVLGAGSGLGSSQHPENNLVAGDAYDSYVDGSVDTDFARGEALIAGIYQALRDNPALFARTMLVITYDEHGGLYDHVPPPTGVPAPATPHGLSTRLRRLLLHRTASAFDFTMLGPRVPAVVVSPLIPAGTLDARTHDHASVPATLRALFAPHARPLTARDAWSPPVHDLATLPEPRTDLPDLSAHVHPAGPAGTPPAGAAPAPAAPTPAYYDDFVGQADLVRRHLESVDEPEVADVGPAGDAAGAAEITRAFAQAAHRHRHTPPG